MFRHRKRLLLLLLSLAVLIAVFGSFLLPRPDARITPANCDRIREGMTRQEVEAILGPPGNYTGWPHAHPPLDDQYWFGEEAFIIVHFHPIEGKAWLAEIFPTSSTYKDRRGRFMDWLRDLGDRFKR
jgi:hypothetical protein